MTERPTNMFSKSSLFLIAVLAVANAARFKPTGLIDTVFEQLEQLKTTVQGDILVAHDNFNDMIMEFGVNSAYVANSAAHTLGAIKTTILVNIQSLKDLAYSAGVDPSSCTEVREEVLNKLPERYTEELVVCITDVDEETKRIADGSKYLVDISFNVVNHLEFDVRRCGEDLSCISPLLNEIELNKIRLPQNIKTEVQAFQSTANSLKLSVQSCSDNKVAQYVTEAYSILANIETCINSLLG